MLLPEYFTYQTTALSEAGLAAVPPRTGDRCAAQLTAVDSGQSIWSRRTAPLRLLLQFAFPASNAGANTILVRARRWVARPEAPEEHSLASHRLACHMAGLPCGLVCDSFAKGRTPKAQPRSQRSVASRGKPTFDAHHLPPAPQGRPTLAN